MTETTKVAPLRPVVKRTRSPNRPDKGPIRDRGDWIAIARKVLIANGIDRVKVEPLAQLLELTTGSFYHHFKNRNDLLEALIEDWETNNNLPLIAAVDSIEDPLEQFRAFWTNWRAGSLSDPAYDSSVRAWARATMAIQARVNAVDDSRIALLQRIFLKLGYDKQRAVIRARVAYFHQVGYQAMEINETDEQRRQLSDYYDEVLLGTLPID